MLCIKHLGYDQFFDAEYYNMTDENTKNYGMKDKPLFQGINANA